MSLSFFVFLAVATGAIVLASIWLAYKRSRDSLHPMVYLGLLLFYLYSYLPINLVRQDAERLQSYLSVQQLDYVQFINLVGAFCICAGVLYGAKKVSFPAAAQQNWVLPPKVKRRLKNAAIVCGILGVLGFVYGISQVGGFAAAYGKAYGGGTSASGYTREVILLTLPALIWLMISQINQKISFQTLTWISIFAAPLLMHGLLGARRGPTAMVLIASVIGWYFVRFKRPRLLAVFSGAVVLGALLLFLVANRGNIYLGSSFEFEGTSSYASEVSSANEFVYGSGVILHADITENYMWGRRYFTIFFIRPIPRFLWPSKYQDASRILGIPDLEVNLGTGGENFIGTLGWPGAIGSAPGIVADMWLEFWWFSFLVLFLIGWFYGMVWRKALTRGGLWTILYTLLSALSVYLVMQTLEAMAFRFLFMTAAAWLVWKYGTRGRSFQELSANSLHNSYTFLASPPHQR
jgi:hypothetical protein